MVSVDASLAVSLGELSTHVGSLGDRIGGLERAMRRPPAQPFNVKLFGEGIVAGGAPDLVIDLGGPNSGRYWNILKWVIGGPTWSTARGGTALLVISATPPRSAASVGITQVDAQAGSLPNIAYFSRAQMVVDSNEHAYAIVLGGTATQEIISTISVEQYETGERQQVEVT